MSVVWSLTAGLIAGLIFRSRSAGFGIGLLVFSHWVLDFISHPMLGGPPDLPLFFEGSPRVGLGLYTTLGLVTATILEFAVFGAGLGLYLVRRRQEVLAEQSKSDTSCINNSP